MTELELVLPDIDYLEEVVAYKAEFLQAGEHLHGGARLDIMSDLSEWLTHVMTIAKGEGLEEGRVPSSTFLCIRQSDQKMVGICNIRHNLSQPFLVNFAGHIGYSIRPSERRKGYAKEQLRLALKEAGKLGITRALVTCDVNNVASEKTILANGGNYDNTYVNPSDGSETKRYWIEVTND
ncbi:GNAT family N-acetyltransferase [Streptococcus hillyeri]|uniref:GNAT family N-acetyltransferase n=1 Tax=Streptococcus hillyeri TaxID=2282420 RepID=A0A3L9DKD3_9STRE|nr:GNAT family N-acetyltransferase [Streptococcus hillyeri]RLY02036.1 GNAT family N-acetyltransferase [Streptococcus hillyeri]